MGYTHYWTINDATGVNLNLPIIRAIMEKHKDLLCFEYDQPDKKPLISKGRIRFNGKGEAGHETFELDLVNGRGQFCKTNRKSYDLVICMIFMALHNEFPHAFSIGSDGFPKDEKGTFDQAWLDAEKELKTFTDFGYDKVENLLYKVRFASREY
jgi:hypothetical protein